jgi:hypothetical protein
LSGLTLSQTIHAHVSLLVRASWISKSSYSPRGWIEVLEMRQVPLVVLYYYRLPSRRSLSK